MKRFLIFGFILVFLSGCAEILSLLKLTSIKKPTVKVTNTQITGLSFSKADLLFDITIDNPNNASISLAGIDYTIKINNNNLLSGNQDDRLTINALGSSIIKIPVGIRYKDLYQAVKSFSEKDKSAYTFEGGLNFNLPVFGNVRIPVSATGELPVIRIPKVKLSKLVLKSYSWSSAALELDIAIKNNSGISLLCNNFVYGLDIAGSSWADGNISDKISLQPNAEKTVKIPFRLNFIEMGRSLYDIVVGDAELNYTLTGKADFIMDHPLFKKENFSFEDLNKIKIFK